MQWEGDRCSGIDVLQAKLIPCPQSLPGACVLGFLYEEERGWGCVSSSDVQVPYHCCTFFLLVFWDVSFTVGYGNLLAKIKSSSLVS